VYRFKPWVPPLVIAGITIPVVAGFAVVGPQLGLALGALAVAALLVFAARLTTKGPIETTRAPDMRRRVLIVAVAELDDEAVAAIRAAGEFERSGNEAEILLLAPATGRAIDRWATDLEAARTEAQRKLVMSAAALGKAGLEARASVGDPDPVLAVEDGLRSFAATEVILATGAAETDSDVERAVAELESRLTQPLRRVEVGEHA
jgi:hypothetical protein